MNDELLVYLVFSIMLVLSTRGTYQFLKKEWNFRNDKKIKLEKKTPRFELGFKFNVENY